MKRDAHQDRRNQTFLAFATVLADPHDLIDHEQLLKAGDEYADKLEELQRLTHPELFYGEYVGRETDDLAGLADYFKGSMEHTIKALCDALYRQADEDDDPEIAETLEAVDMYTRMFITQAQKFRNAIGALSEIDEELAKAHMLDVEEPTAHNELSITEAAGILGTSRQAVHQLIQRGNLDAQKVGSTWVISRESVEERRANR